MGTIDSKKICPTCEKTTEECPGHLGILNLPTYFIHPFFRKVVVKILQCVCNTCNSLLVSEETLKQNGIIQSKGYKRLDRIAELSKDSKIRCKNGCPNNPKFTLFLIQEKMMMLMFFVL